MPLLAHVRAVLLLAASVWFGGCATLPPPGPRMPSHALTEVGDTPLARIVRGSMPAVAVDTAGLSGFRLLPEAEFSFEARVALIRRAQMSLDVQYYHIQHDEVGLLFLRELRDAAARGVRVRLLMDDLYTGGEDMLLLGLAAHPNVELRLFNPLPSRAESLSMRFLFSLHEFGRINHRMHNKLLVADNSCAVTGGRNIASEYFMRNTAANFIDMDLLSCGPVVREMSAGFDRYWNSEQVRPVGEVIASAVAPSARRAQFDALAGEGLPELPVRAHDVMDRSSVGRQLDGGALELRWASSQLFVDDPRKIVRGSDAEAFRGSVTEGALRALDAARHEVTIVSPYFVPGERGMAMMKQATGGQPGRIFLVTNSLGATDEPLVYAGYTRYRAEMLRIGVTIREIAPELTGRSGHFGDFGRSISRLHAKLAVVDDRFLFIGSMNMDHRSAAVNTESGLLIDSPELVADYRTLVAASRSSAAYRLRLASDGHRVQWVESDDDGKDIVHEDEPGGHYWLRFKNWLLLPWVGESLL
ncbi:phospholipase D family protein [Variovorax defluvii]|uniref:Phospholipase D family protein n=1 Tax=Variovorax defluvii TaxID=913761 RepID=A0ABP8H9A7_9BURK